MLNYFNLMDLTEKKSRENLFVDFDRNLNSNDKSVQNYQHIRPKRNDGAKRIEGIQKIQRNLMNPKISDSKIVVKRKKNYDKYYNSPPYDVYVHNGSLFHIHDRNKKENRSEINSSNNSFYNQMTKVTSCSNLI